MNDILYEGLDPGIRETVRWLRANGFETTDSGDGHSKEESISEGSALDFPHVYMVTDPAKLVSESHRLRELIGPNQGRIEANYSPDDGIAVLVLVQFDDSQL